MKIYCNCGEIEMELYHHEYNKEWYSCPECNKSIRIYDREK